MEDEAFTHLPISFFHGDQVAALPDHHRDPFGRMLVAQAQADGLVIVTSDPAIKEYPVRVVNAET